MVRKILFFAVSLLFISQVYGQVEEKVFTDQIYLEKSSFLVNETFKIEISLSSPQLSSSNFIIENSPFPEGLQLVSGPNIRPGYSGSVIDYFFKPVKEGRFLIDSFIIKTKKETFFTVPIFIIASKVFQVSENFDRIPPTVRWNIPSGTYYPGSVVPLCFVVENAETDNFTISSSVSQNDKGLVKKSDRFSGKSEKEVIPIKVMNGEVYNIIYHDYIFIPLESGSVILPDLEIFVANRYKRYRILLKGVSIRVNSPNADNSTGAVGRFTYNYEILGETVSDKQAVFVKQQITGKGNFYGIQVPKPYIDNSEIAEITLLSDKFNVKPSGEYFEGDRALLYVIEKKLSEEKNAETETGIEQETEKFLNLIIPDFVWTEKNYSSNNSEKKGKLKTKRGIAAKIKILLSSSKADIVKTVFKDKKDNILKIIIYIPMLLLLPGIFFAAGKKYKIAVLFAITAVSFTVVAGFPYKEPIYGEISEAGGKSPFVPVYIIPEETSSVKFYLPVGSEFKIINQKEGYFLIETPDQAEGWIKKENRE